MTRAPDVDWSGICRICELADTERCRSCPTRSKALMAMAAAFHARWRWTITYLGFVATATVAVAVAGRA